MKKIVLTIFIFLCMPVLVCASEIDPEDVNYKINHFFVNADIQENGDVYVTELISLKGTFNGYERDLVYKNNNSNNIYNAGGFTLLEIAAKKESNVSFATMNDTDFTILKANSATNGGYLEKYITNGNRYRMYYLSKKDMVVFRISYIIKDVVILHNDVAELYWTFIGESFDDKLSDVQIKVNLPREDTSDAFRLWAHGELSGEIHDYDNKYVLATVEKLNAKSSVDIRLTFHPSLMDKTIVTKQTNQNALESIIKTETERAEQANKERTRIKIIYYSLLGASILYYISILVAWIRTYLKYDKEYKSTFTNEYNREFIDDYNVEVVDYLMNKNITSNALSASIMNLIYKKAIKVEEIPSNKKKKEYKFTLEENRTKINETESYLIDFLFTKVGKDNTFTTLDLKSYAKGTKTCETFSKKYTTWKNKVIKEGKNQNFFENTSKAIATGVLFLLVAIILNALSFLLNAFVLIVYLTIFVAVIFLIYTCAFYRRTKVGNEHYAKWKAFKKFLNDFGTFDTKELPEITLWERYMVYATLFGLAEKVSKSMNVKIKELGDAGIYTGNYSPTFSDWYVFHSIDHIITSSVQSNVNAVNAARANSISSSGSGFGGGFSSGGGFGGGGGGGRGF